MSIGNSSDNKPGIREILALMFIWLLAFSMAFLVYWKMKHVLNY